MSVAAGRDTLEISPQQFDVFRTGRANYRIARMPANRESHQYSELSSLKPILEQTRFDQTPCAALQIASNSFLETFQNLIFRFEWVSA